MTARSSARIVSVGISDIAEGAVCTGHTRAATAATNVVPTCRSSWAAGNGCALHSALAGVGVIYFHSVRTFVLASLYADSRTPKLTFKRELVMLASLFHDIGRVRLSRDHTLYARVGGTVQFSVKGEHSKKTVSILAEGAPA